MCDKVAKSLALSGHDKSVLDGNYSNNAEYIAPYICGQQTFPFHTDLKSLYYL